MPNLPGWLDVVLILVTLSLAGLAVALLDLYLVINFPTWLTRWKSWRNRRQVST